MRPIEDPCIVLDWDSEFWGFQVARVRVHVLTPAALAGIDEWCNARAIACLYFLATFDDPETVRTAEDSGFRLTDTRVTLGRATAQPVLSIREGVLSEIAIRSCVSSDLTFLQQIAGVSHQDTRFYFDQHFPRIKCQELYELWIAKSCAGYADRVLVAESDGMPVGYITCHLPKHGVKAGSIGLAGVAARARGHGVGRRLVHHALDWFAGQQIEEVTVVTQGRNIRAQVLYQRCGFVTRSHKLWYHKWYRLPEWTMS